LETPGIDGRIILKLIFRKCDEGMDWIDVSGQEHGAGSCECGNESSDSIKRGEYLDWLRTC
jgi:hypothetical protein